MNIYKEEERAIRREIINSILHAIHFGENISDIRKAVREHEVDYYGHELKAYAE